MKLYDLITYYNKNFNCDLLEINLDDCNINNLGTNIYGYIKFNKNKIEEVIKKADLLGISVVIDVEDININNLDFLEKINQKTNLVVEFKFCSNISMILKEFKKRKINVVVTLIDDFINLETAKILENTQILANNKVHGIRIKSNVKYLHNREINIIRKQLEFFKEDVIIYEIPNKDMVIKNLIKNNSYQGFNRSILNKAKQIMENHVKSNDLVVDMTIGNGNDTLFLCKLVKNGMVFGFDIQKEAISNTTKLLKENFVNNYSLFLESHEYINKSLEKYIGKISLILFNLGYLPKGDKTIMTNYKSTLKALINSLKIIKDNGIILMVCYPHEEGIKEAITIKEYLQKNSIHYDEYHNTDNVHAPYLIVINKN